ncbi:N-acetylmuramoyl-L-alanine amidase [Kaistia soli DSM 19436]|uniref:N-acetylmuramoyl-L-alanine amidase n=1 Tax=Kaistia soli DSM 19436 TaxID=1122133 RepID=A0A1M5GZB5_9HYPH|nr:N-acetylmuramoyl-L-alanine amidase [Kaistia soli]SHG08986.1 N-acetylmuramoyl-L-alanine amidase [Kaistia soli DSM 19436]
MLLKLTTYQSRCIAPLLRVTALLALLVGAFPGPAAAADEGGLSVPATTLVAHDARVVGDGARTRFVMDLTDTTTFAVFPLDEPDRVVIDLPGVGFALPEGTGHDGKGLVSAFRFGQISAGKSRIVLDVNAPVAIDKSFVLPPADGQSAKLVVDLVPTSRESFASAVRLYRDKEQEAVAASAPPVPPPSDGRLRVVIDPGHGGIDSGAIAKSGTLEKNVVLAFAKTVAKKLEASGRYEVLMTRSDDSFISLGGRVAFARSHHADLFVSIHADSFWGEDVRGATIYTLSDRASDKMAAQIAESENKSDILAGVAVTEDTSEVSDILIDLARRETKNFAVVFARNMIKELKPNVRLFKHAHQQAGFMVLKAPDVPSALVELGYLSNQDDEKLLTSDAWRDKTADAMTRAVDNYFRLRVAQTTTGSIDPATVEQ